MKKDDFAKTVADVAVLDDGSKYRLADVKRILDALPEAVVQIYREMKVGEKVTLPGFIAISKSLKKAWVSGIDGKKHPDTEVARVSVTTSLKKRLRG